MHDLARHPGRDNLSERHAFDELESEMLEWMGDPNYTGEILYMPFFAASVAPELFVMPAFSDFFPLLDVDLKRARDLARILSPGSAGPLGTSSAEAEIALDSLPAELQVTATHFATALHALFHMMDAKEEIFSVGPFSKMLGAHLEQLHPARQRRKTAANRASLILVDRTLDLAGPASCSFETLLDKIRGVSDPLPGHANDVQVDMSELFGMKKGETENGAMCPGCLCDSHQKKRNNRELSLSRLIMDSESLVLTCARRELAKARPDKASPTDNEDLRSTINAFREQNKLVANNLDLLQRSTAIVDALDGGTWHETVAKVQEKFFHQLCDSEEAAQGFLVEIVKLVRNRKERGLALHNILVVLAYTYGLMPPGVEFYAEDEDRLKSVFSEAIVQDRDDLGSVLSTMAKGMVVDEILAHQMVETVFKKLHCLPASRGKLSDPEWHRLNSKGGYDGILAKVMRDIYSDQRKDVKDLFHHQQGLVGNMLKSSISLFGVSVNKMHPRENPIILLLVVGGMTAAEAKAVRQIVEAKSTEVNFMVGATRLLVPSDCVSLLFEKDPLMTDKSV